MLIKIIFFLLLNSIYLIASTPMIWQDCQKKDFYSGKLNNIIISNKNYFSLGYKTRKIYKTNNPENTNYIFSIQKKDKYIYFGSGDKCQLTKINIKNNKKKILFEDTTAVGVNNILIEKKNVYFTAFPLGKIYNIYKNHKLELICDLPDSYVWKIVKHKNKLYAATGPNGKLYEVNLKTKKYKLLFKSKGKNITTLLLKNNILYFAVAPNGQLFSYDISNNKYDAICEFLQDEITSIVKYKNIFIINANKTENNDKFKYTFRKQRITNKSRKSGSKMKKQFESSDKSKKKIYNKNESEKVIETKIEVNKITSVLQNSENSIIYLLQNKRIMDSISSPQKYIVKSVIKDNILYFITANKNMLYSYNLDTKENILLYDFEKNKPLDLIVTEKDIYVSTAKPAEIYGFSFMHNDTGTFVSSINDCKNISFLGSVFYYGKNINADNFKIQYRAGLTSKPDNTWSEWQNIEKKISDFRYLQYKVNLKNRNKLPKIEKIEISYKNYNQKPKMLKIDYIMPNFNNPFIDKSENNKESNQENNFILDKISNDKKISEIKWNAKDDDEDKLVYNVYYTLLNSGKFNKLNKKDFIFNKKIKWNTENLPDGYYKIKVEVMDILNNKNNFLKDYMISNKFLIDNNSPVIENFSVKNNEIRFNIKDDFSKIGLTYYSIDNKTFYVLEPIDKINDSKQEKYSLKFQNKKDFYLTIKSADLMNNSLKKTFFIKGVK